MAANLTPLKAIRAKCCDCSCYQWKEIELCTVRDCPLWEYRFGERPDTARLKGRDTLNSEQTAPYEGV